LHHWGLEQRMNISKLKVSRSVLAAILLALIGGLVTAYLAYHVHITPPEGPLDMMSSSYPR